MRPPGRATVLAAIAFTLGLLLAPDHFLSWTVLFIPVGLLVLTGISLRFKSPESVRTMLLMLIFVSVGWIHGVPHPPPQLPEGAVWVEGTVRIPVERYDDRLRYRLSLHRWWAVENNGGELDLGAVVYLPDSVVLQPGEEVRMIARFDHFVSPRNPGDIDWRSYWENRNVSVRLRSVQNVEPLGINKFFGGWTRQIVGDWRAGINDLIQSHLSPTTQPLAQALLIGDRSQWENDLRDRIALSGLMHLFAISGLHVALMLLIAVSVLSGLGFGPRITSLIALPLLLLLVPLTGGNPPVVRASIIISVAIIGRAIQRNTDPFHILAISYLLLLFIHPQGLYDAGFQLSFAGAAGTLYASMQFGPLTAPTRKYATTRARFIHRWSRRFALAFLVSLYAWLFTAPILITHFGRIALLGPLITLPALLTVTLALSAGWTMVAVGWWPWLSGVFGASMDVLLAATEWLANMATQHLPTLDFLPLSATVIAVIILVLVLIGTYRIVRQPLSGSLLVGVGVTVILVFGSMWQGQSDRVKVAFLDVGQGDAVLIRSGKRAVLIDTGSGYTHTAVDQLKRLGIRELDLMLISHGDADHCGAVPELVREVNVSAALVGPGTSHDRAGAAAIQALREAGTDVRVASSGATLSGPWGKLTCLYPLNPEADSLKSDNAQSLIWLWECEGVSAVFSGDAPNVVERELVRTQTLPDIDLLMAGHHGSRSSTSARWLNALTPEMVIVSCGINNQYGHPAADVLTRIVAIDTGVFRTDLMGAVLFEVRGEEFHQISHSQWW